MGSHNFIFMTWFPPVFDFQKECSCSKFLRFLCDLINKLLLQPALALVRQVSWKCYLVMPLLPGPTACKVWVKVKVLPSDKVKSTAQIAHSWRCMIRLLKQSACQKAIIVSLDMLLSLLLSPCWPRVSPPRQLTKYMLSRNDFRVGENLQWNVRSRLTQKKLKLCTLYSGSIRNYLSK